MRYRVEAKEADRTGCIVMLLSESDIPYVEAGDFLPSSVALAFHVNQADYNAVEIGDMVTTGLTRIA